MLATRVSSHRKVNNRLRVEGIVHPMGFIVLLRVKGHPIQSRDKLHACAEAGTSAI
jgi:hypothetical protein